MAKRHRINHRLSTSDTILFVIGLQEGAGELKEFTRVTIVFVIYRVSPGTSSVGADVERPQTG